jgi:hypothetical protein
MIPQAPEAVGDPAAADSLAALETRLQRQLLGRVRDFRLVADGAGVVLRGYTRSYHAKQVAQHAVLGATRLPIRANEIEVS